MKNVIELIRVSTEEQAAADRASIPAQAEVNRRTCAVWNLHIVKTIQIADVSGASILQAPEMDNLLRLIQSKDIHGVVAREFSRMMRPENFDDFAILQKFTESNTLLYLPEGPIDFGNKMGRLLGTMRAAIAGLERTEILERVWSAKEAKRRRGELAQSHVVLPFGVGYDKIRGFFYKPEAERVREAFRLFLTGEQSYARLARMVGVTPRGMHLILRNPIWTGWRVIDKKRDTSPAGRYPAKDGRQSDRRKICRSPEEVIRFRVIDQPMVSEAEFQVVQQIMNVKQAKHWRSRPEYEHRFIYNGFVTCARCGEPVQTALARADYYVCRGRRSGHECRARYMNREKLEAQLDRLFAGHLTSPAFLETCIEELKKRAKTSEFMTRSQRLASQVEALRKKRYRVIDCFVEERIESTERDRRLARIDEELKAIQHRMLTELPPPVADLPTFVEAFAPLAEWEFWTREQKRSLLAALVPEIHVADYQVSALGLNPALFSNKDIHTGKDSWLQSA